MRHILAVLFLIPLLSSAAEGVKHALLVGVQDYKGTGLGNLKYCENDVHGLAKLLPNLGYATENIILLTRKASREKDSDALRPTATNVRKWLVDVCKSAKPADTVLLAFAGHGAQLKQTNKMYFCPLEANLDKLDTLISLDEIYAMMEKDCLASVTVMLVDACRNDPLEGRAAGDERIVSVTLPQIPDPPGGMAAFFSCSKGQKAFESDELQHGVFFNCVIEALGGKALNAAGEVTVPQLEDYISQRVPAIVKKEQNNPDIMQIPERRGTLRGTTVLASAPAFQLRLMSAREYVKKENYQKAVEEFEAALKLTPEDEKVKGELGDALAELGAMYEDGKGNYVKSDSQAIELYKRGAQFESRKAQSYLASMYLTGKGTEKDERQAARWYRKAADQGWPTAQAWLGSMYRDGHGVTQDYAEAMRWFRKAADQGNPYGQNGVGYLYREGKGVAQDYAESIRWLRKAADQGNSYAENELGHRYEYGEGVAKDYAEAIRWYRKAADQGNSSGQNNLGTMYDHGLGVAQDYVEAMRLYRKSADQGNATAQNNIGVMYGDGNGVAKDHAEAIRWYRMAAKQGLQKARDNLRILGASE